MAHADNQEIERTGPGGSIDKAVGGATSTRPSGRRGGLGGDDRSIRRRPYAALHVLVGPSRRFRDEGRVGKAVLHVGGAGRGGGVENRRDPQFRVGVGLVEAVVVDNPNAHGNSQVVHGIPRGSGSLARPNRVCRSIIGHRRPRSAAVHHRIAHVETPIVHLRNACERGHCCPVLDAIDAPVGRGGRADKRADIRPDRRIIHLAGPIHVGLVEIPHLLLVQVGQELGEKGWFIVRDVRAEIRVAQIPRETAERGVEVVHCQADLLQVVLALRAAGRFARLLHGGKQQGDENADDGDHHQQLDQGETALSKTTFHRR